MIDPRRQTTSEPSKGSEPPATLRRALTIAAGVAAISSWAIPAQSAPEHLRDEEACVTTLKNAKTREQEGSLQSAKALLRSCAQSPCSLFVRQQCANRHNKLELDTPTIVLLVSDASGGARTDVQVRVDGEPFATQVDGRALPIDPGMHDFSFSADGHVFATQKILIVQGQRNRFISATIGKGGGGAVAADDSAQPTEQQVAAMPAMKHPKASRSTKTAAADESGAAEDKADGKSSHKTGGSGATAAAGAEDEPAEAEKTPARAGGHRYLPWVLTGVGVASLGAGAMLTSWGRKDNDQLKGCSPGCDPNAVHHIRRVYQAADVAIGVGIAALGAAYWVYALTHGSSSGEEHGSETALRFGVAPTGSGGFASVSGGF